MKKLLFATALALGSNAVFAGVPAYVEPAPMAPLPQPTLWNWFAGGGVGYLLDAEEEMYSGHLGVDFPASGNGIGQAVYLEVGYFSIEDSYDEVIIIEPQLALQGAGFPTTINRTHIDLDVVPITLNYKLEFPITGALNAYLGAGAGIALLDVDFKDNFGSDSDDDTTFYGQAFAGLLYNATEAFELYGGGRWIYIDDSNLLGEDLDSQDDWVVELGARFNF